MNYGIQNVAENAHGRYLFAHVVTNGYMPVIGRAP
jgi:hypothetical protein